MIEILGINLEDYDEDYLRQLHRETLTVLEIFLSTGKMKAGKYKSNDYKENWKLCPNTRTDVKNV